MRKRNFNKLSLNKKTISGLDTNGVKGGTGNHSHDPACLQPSGVSACLPCIENPTEGCAPPTEQVCITFGCPTDLCFSNRCS